MNGTELPFFYGPVRVYECVCVVLVIAQAHIVFSVLHSQAPDNKWNTFYISHALAHKFTQQTASTSRTQRTHIHS